MCRFCEKVLSKVYDASIKTVVCLFNNAITGEVNMLITQDKKGGAEAVVIPVKFCPWCGNPINYSEVKDERV